MLFVAKEVDFLRWKQTQNRPQIWKRSACRPCRVMWIQILDTAQWDSFGTILVCKIVSFILYLDKKIIHKRKYYWILRKGQRIIYLMIYCLMAIIFDAYCLLHHNYLVHIFLFMSPLTPLLFCSSTINKTFSSVFKISQWPQWTHWTSTLTTSGISILYQNSRTFQNLMGDCR